MRIQKNKQINHLGVLNISADIVSVSSHADGWGHAERFLENLL